MGFTEDFISFLLSNRVCFKRHGDTEFEFEKFGLRITLVNFIEKGAFTVPEPKKGTIYLYEDRWARDNGTVRLRILAHLGRFDSVFARNCTVKRIDTEISNFFLDQYHSYGSAKTKYKYGLYHRDSLVAVSCFSSARNIARSINGREIPLRSYEWVRYAGLPNLRISGGMGKMMATFINDVHPQEIMSYADLEWSQGDVYRTLGFTEAGTRQPVSFWVDTGTMERRRTPSERSIPIMNMGSRKFLLQVPQSQKEYPRQEISLQVSEYRENNRIQSQTKY